jgi:hypothetical protein
MISTFRQKKIATEMQRLEENLRNQEQQEQQEKRRLQEKKQQLHKSLSKV